MTQTAHTKPSPTAADATTQAQRAALADWAILAACLLLFAALGAWYTPFVPDDSYISYRYADHLANGQGLTFNPGSSPVEGYSNFLWVVVLALLSRTGLDVPSSAAFLGWVYGALAVVLLWWILRRRRVSGWPLALTVGLLALSGPLALYAVSGLETSLFAVLLLTAVLVLDYLFESRALWPAAVFGVIGFLLALTRPEGIVALPVLTLCLLVFSHWSSTREETRGLGRASGVALGVFAVLLVLYHVWRVGYFDSFWPTPFLSKGVGGGLPVDTWITNLRNLFLRQTHYYAPFGTYYGALALLALVGAALGWPRRHELYVEYSALVLATVYLAVYLNFADWMPGGRYLAPLVGLWLIPFSLLATELRLPAASGAVRAALPYTLLVTVVAAMSLGGVALLRTESLRLQTSTAVSLVPLGQWLRDSVPAGSVLAISDVGATPYFSGLETVDINPESLTDRHIAENGWSSDYFFDVDPDVVVFTAFSLDKPDFYGVHEELYANPRFQETYERVGVVRNDWYQDRSYWVFLRRGLPVSAAQLSTLPVGLSKQ
jgi:hypothetical protein